MLAGCESIPIWMIVVGENKKVRFKTSQMIVTIKFLIIGVTVGFEVKLIFNSIL